MKNFAVVCLLGLVAGCGDVPIDGIGRSGWGEPVGYPPAGYLKDVWVDARGCAFIATGSPANRGWVPYVGADLQHVCRK